MTYLFRKNRPYAFYRIAYMLCFTVAYVVTYS